MKVTPTAIADVLLVEPEVHADERGFSLRVLMHWNSGAQPALPSSLCKTTIHDRRAMCSGACITR